MDFFRDSEIVETSAQLFLFSILLASLFLGAFYMNKRKTCSYSADQDRLEQSGCSCWSMGCVSVLILGGLYLYCCSVVFNRTVHSDSDSGNMQHSTQVNKPTASRTGVMSVLARERPHIFSHYEELQYHIAKNKAHIKKLEDALSTISTNSGRLGQIKNISSAKKMLKGYCRSASLIEEYAGKLYFARFLSNLGTRFETSDIERRLENVYRDSKNKQAE